jgi:hypothetical protein
MKAIKLFLFLVSCPLFVVAQDVSPFMDVMSTIQLAFKKSVADIASKTPAGVVPSVDIAANQQLSYTNALLENINAVQQGSFVRTIKQAFETYKATTEIVGFAKSSYETAVSAVDIAKRAAGDVEGMADFKSYSLYFNRVLDTEQAKFNNTHRSFVDFNAIYNARLRRFISPEGVLDPLKIGEAYAANPQLGYSGILADLASYNRGINTYNCNQWVQMAMSEEQKADLLENEAANISKMLMYGSIGPSFDRLVAAGNKLDITLGDKKGTLGKSFADFGSDVNKLFKGAVKEELNTYGASKGYTGTDVTTGLSKYYQELLKGASELRQNASFYRSQSWSLCGGSEVYNELYFRSYHMDGNCYSCEVLGQ